VFFGIGAYTSTYLATVHGVSPFLGMLAGGVIAAVVGVIIGYLPFRWHLGKLTFALLTLAVAYAFEFTVQRCPRSGATTGCSCRRMAPGFGISARMIHAGRWRYCWSSSPRSCCACS